MPEKSLDRFDISAILVVVVCVFSILCTAIVFLHTAIRLHTGQEETMHAIRALNLSNLAFAPSGQPQRSQELSSAGVDLRFVPSLPRTSPDLTELFLRVQSGSPCRGYRCQD